MGGQTYICTHPLHTVTRGYVVISGVSYSYMIGRIYFGGGRGGEEEGRVRCWAVQQPVFPSQYHHSMPMIKSEDM
jgi:hypothetical protein